MTSMNVLLKGRRNRHKIRKHSLIQLLRASFRTLEKVYVYPLRELQNYSVRILQDKPFLENAYSITKKSISLLVAKNFREGSIYYATVVEFKEDNPLFLENAYFVTQKSLVCFSQELWRRN